MSTAAGEAGRGDLFEFAAGNARAQEAAVIPGHITTVSGDRPSEQQIRGIAEDLAQSHAPDCAVALSARHACSCGAEQGPQCHATAPTLPRREERRGCHLSSLESPSIMKLLRALRELHAEGHEWVSTLQWQHRAEMCSISTHKFSLMVGIRKLGGDILTNHEQVNGKTVWFYRLIEPQAGKEASE